ncbi:MAG: hypothetical protein WC786_01095 [Patescibacteria group bacterium]|jgi:hypothetical protein
MKYPLTIIAIITLLLTATACTKNTPTTNTPVVVNTIVNQGIAPTESGCPQEGHIKSPASTNAATITFDNQTGADLKVYWLDFNGARKFYTDVKAHSKKDQATWVGHVWVVADGAGQCVKLHSANAVAQTLVID